MPTLESLDYEHFTYDEASNKPLTLDEAVKKASELRRDDKGNYYRVRPIDENANAFRVDKIPVSAAYAAFISRLSKTWAYYLSRARESK